MDFGWRRDPDRRGHVRQLSRGASPRIAGCDDASVWLSGELTPRSQWRHRAGIEAAVPASLNRRIRTGFLRRRRLTRRIVARRAPPSVKLGSLPIAERETTFTLATAGRGG